VLDEAGARVKLNNTTMPDEVVDIQKRIKVIVRQMDHAISTKEFDRAIKLKDQELQEREAASGDQGSLEGQEIASSPR